MSGYKKTFIQLFLFVSIGIPFAQTTTSSDNSIVILFYYALCLPVWTVSVWYWWRHYYVRNGLVVSIIGAIVAFIFSGLSIFAMVLDFLYRNISGTNPEIGPCPNCGKNKIVSVKSNPIPHAFQPQCPHCNIRALDRYNKLETEPGIVQALQALKVLHDQGLISDEEYEQKRSEIMRRF